MDSRVRLVPAHVRHVGRIASRMRPIDRRECQATGREPKAALRNAFLTSSKAWTALVDGKAEAMFGVVVVSSLCGEGVPWFLGTDEVYRHGRELLMWGPGMISRLCDSRLTLRNLVSVENSQALRLLRRWGFVIGEDVVEVGGVSFRHFEKVPA